MPCTSLVKVDESVLTVVSVMEATVRDWEIELLVTVLWPVDISVCVMLSPAEVRIRFALVR